MTSFRSTGARPGAVVLSACLGRWPLSPPPQRNAGGVSCYCFASHVKASMVLGLGMLFLVGLLLHRVRTFVAL